jgi:hypothetical protein
MDQEEWHLRKFIRVCPDVPTGKLCFEDIPDLRIHTKIKIVGIEHTQVINNKDNNLKATEEMEKLVLGKAQDIIEKDNSEHLYVCAYFNPGTQLNKYETDDIAIALSDLVKTNIPQKGQHTQIHCWTTQKEHLKKIETVDITWYEKSTKGFWAVPMGGVIPEITSEIINSRIEEKELKISSYLESCDEIWLLIVIDGHTPSGSWSIPVQVIENNYITNFDHVYLFENFEKTYFELPFA